MLRGVSIKQSGDSYEKFGTVILPLLDLFAGQNPERCMTGMDDKRRNQGQRNWLASRRQTLVAVLLASVAMQLLLETPFGSGRQKALRLSSWTDSTGRPRKEPSSDAGLILLFAKPSSNQETDFTLGEIWYNAPPRQWKDNRIVADRGNCAKQTCPKATTGDG